MKPLLTLIVGLLAVGCMTPEQNQKTLRDSVVGEYEHKKRGHKYVFLENGAAEGYVHGNRQKAEEYKWSIVGGEIHVKYDSELINVYRINEDKSITYIAEIFKDVKRTDWLKDEQTTYKKIK